MAEVTPWVISWPMVSRSTCSGSVVPSPSPVIMQKQLSDHWALSHWVPTWTKTVAPRPSFLMPLRPKVVL